MSTSAASSRHPAVVAMIGVVEWPSANSENREAARRGPPCQQHDSGDEQQMVPSGEHVGEAEPDERG
jgi:hypothetical protein